MLHLYNSSWQGYENNEKKVVEVGRIYKLRIARRCELELKFNSFINLRTIHSDFQIQIAKIIRDERAPLRANLKQPASPPDYYVL